MAWAGDSRRLMRALDPRGHVRRCSERDSRHGLGRCACACGEVLIKPAEEHVARGQGCAPEAANRAGPTIGNGVAKVVHDGPPGDDANRVNQPAQGVERGAMAGQYDRARVERRRARPGGWVRSPATAECANAGAAEHQLERLRVQGIQRRGRRKRRSRSAPAGCIAGGDTRFSADIQPVAYRHANSYSAWGRLRQRDPRRRRAGAPRSYARSNARQALLEQPVRSSSSNAAKAAASRESTTVLRRARERARSRSRRCGSRRGWRSATRSASGHMPVATRRPLRPGEAVTALPAAERIGADAEHHGRGVGSNTSSRVNEVRPVRNLNGLEMAVAARKEYSRRRTHAGSRRLPRTFEHEQGRPRRATTARSAPSAECRTCSPAGRPRADVSSPRAAHMTASERLSSPCASAPAGTSSSVTWRLTASGSRVASRRSAAPRPRTPTASGPARETQRPPRARRRGAIRGQTESARAAHARGRGFVRRARPGTAMAAERDGRGSEPRARPEWRGVASAGRPFLALAVRSKIRARRTF